MVVPPKPAPTLPALSAGAAAVAAAYDPLFKPHPKQAVAMSCPADVILFGGAVGGGKSEGIKGKVLAHLQRYGAWARVLVLRRTVNEVRDLRNRFRRPLARLDGKYNGTERTWTMPDGGTVQFGYLETESDAERYWGFEYTLIVIDEVGHYPDEAPIRLVASRLRSVAPAEIGMQCQLFLTANPGGAGHAWLKAKFIDGKEPCRLWTDEVTQLTHCYIPSYITDNPNLAHDKKYIGRVKGSGPSWLVRALLRGDWSVSVSGTVFFREWFANNRFDNEPAPGEVLQVIQSWDMANKDGPKNDRSACITIAVTEKAAYVVHAWAGRITFPDQVRKMKDMASRKFCGHTPAVILVEDKGNGIGLIQQLKRETNLPIIAVDPGRIDKRTRAVVQSMHFETEPRKVLFPQMADWLDELVEELCAFGEAPHDDLVDAIVQAIGYIFKRFNLSGVRQSLGLELVAKGKAAVKQRLPFNQAPPEEQQAYEEEAVSEPHGW